MTEHVHQWGKLERSTFAGTSHRKCQVRGCDFVNAYDDDIPDESYPASDRERCGECGDWKWRGADDCYGCEIRADDELERVAIDFAGETPRSVQGGQS